MVLFEVPGWSLSTDPVPESSTQVTKKRKRPSSEHTKTHSLSDVNLEKLLKKFKDEAGSSLQNVLKRDTIRESTESLANAKTKKKHKKTKKVHEISKETISRPLPMKPLERSEASTSTRQQKRARMKYSDSARASTLDHHEPAAVSPKRVTKPPQEGAANLTALQVGMKQSLDGARFRLINESLYKTNSEEAQRMMRESPHVFEEYHNGFRHQVQAWPTNPVQHYIDTLSNYPPKTVIADLGCGDAALAQSLIPQGMTVLSFDLVSDGTFVIEADTCSKLPLPGSEGTGNEKTNGEGHIVDVVVCALSLMSTNWPNCLREAWRVLRPDGELRIAEVASRFENVEEFQALVTSIGFRLDKKDSSNTHFTLFEFRKVARIAKSEKEWKRVMEKAGILKPCEYKRR